MALGGIQVINPDVKLFYKRQNNSVEEGEISLSFSSSLPPLPSSSPPLYLSKKTSQKWISVVSYSLIANF